MAQIAYPIILHGNDQQGYNVTAPDIPGVVVTGKTKLDAQQKAQYAILTIIGEMNHYPVPSLISEVKVTAPDLLQLVIVDIKTLNIK